MLHQVRASVAGDVAPPTRPRYAYADHPKVLLVCGVIVDHSTMAWTGGGEWVFDEPHVREPLLSVLMLLAVIGALLTIPPSSRNVHPGFPATQPGPGRSWWHRGRCHRSARLRCATTRLGGWRSAERPSQTGAPARTGRTAPGSARTVGRRPAGIRLAGIDPPEIIDRCHRPPTFRRGRPPAPLDPCGARRGLRRRPAPYPSASRRLPGSERRVERECRYR